MSQAGANNTSGGGGGAVVETLTGNSGGAVPPTANNINVVGSGGITVAGNPGTSTLTISASGGLPYFSLTPFIVGPDVHSQYTTIGAAITAAVAAGASSTAPANIYIKPQSGGYTENVVLQDGINLIGFNGASRPGATSSETLITGKTTFSGAGTASIAGLQLQTNGDYLLEITGASAVIVNISGCYLNATNANAIHCTNSSSIIYLNNTNGSCSTNTFFIATGGEITCEYCVLVGANTTTISTLGSSNFASRHSYFSFPLSNSGTGNMSFEWTQVSVLNAIAITYGGSGDQFVSHSRIESGTASAVSIGAASTVPIFNSGFQSSNANVLTGTGILKYALLTFYGTSSATNVSTQTPLATLL